MSSDSEIQAVRAKIESALPELDEISDDELREMVVDVWATGLVESDYDSLNQLKFGSGFDNLGEESQVHHVREVTRCALALADTLRETRDIDIDRDAVAAGGLLHDVSKFHEKSPDREGWTELAEMLPHPHYAVHMLADAGLSHHLQHIVLAHTDRSNPQPKTIEAQLVLLGDLASGDAIFWNDVSELMFDVQGETIQ